MMASDPTLTTLGTMKPTSGRGGIGGRAGFRFLFFGCGFKSHRPYYFSGRVALEKHISSSDP